MESTYCVKCKVPTQNLEMKPTLTKNEKRAMRSICQKCGSNKFRFVNKTMYDRLMQHQQPQPELSSLLSEISNIEL